MVCVRYIGMAIAAKMPMIAMTINNSINVKPFSLFLNIILTSFYFIRLINMFHLMEPSYNFILDAFLTPHLLLLNFLI